MVELLHRVQSGLQFGLKSAGFLLPSSEDLLLFLAGMSTKCLHIYSTNKITSLYFYIFLYTRCF